MKRKISSLILCVSILLIAMNSTFPSLAYSDELTSSCLIKLKRDVDLNNFVSKGLNENVIIFKNLNSLAVNLNPSESELLQNDENIKIIENNSPVNILPINDVVQSEEFINKVETQFNKNMNPDQKIRIAVLDTGVSTDADLEINQGVCFVSGSSSYNDDNGHGTQTAKSIKSLVNRINSENAAPELEIYSVKILDSQGSGSYSQVIQGIDWATKNGINIMVMNFGGSKESHILHKAIQEATTNGVLFISTASKTAESDTTEVYPAAYPEVISTQLTDNANSAPATLNEITPALESTALTLMDASQVVYDYQYDDGNRLVRILANGVTVLELVYDDNGNLLMTSTQ